MALTPSSMLPLGTKAPSFNLLNTITGKNISLEETRSDIATVIMFICNHCPYVKHIQTVLVNIAKKYQAKEISFIAINSNDVEHYPDDSPDNMRKNAETYGYTFPYLFDETQTVAKAYHAACTPDFYVFDHHLACVYRGRFDDSTPSNGIPVTGNDLSKALDAILAEKTIKSDQKPSMGCNIKWKK
ncbi:MAG: anti-oxidant AhpCTSA family protein [uncultured bacterium]|nr:MAG: anti-oxidant AhpCTSA family protein [uncultured bacterium]